MKRRFHLVIALAWPGLLCAAPAGSVADPSARPIREVVPDFNQIRKWNASNGDTGDPFWADDDNLYTFMCDGSGFGKGVMNLNFNKLTGTAWADLVGTPVNPMAEYGKGNQKGPDNATWKVCGQECIDGVFYAFVARNVYGKDNKSDPLMRQSSFNASLIKSTDRGLTWTRSAEENYAAPMWPGTRFGAPSFVHYGKNGGRVAKDEADRYAYALSNNGFWNGGDDFILGRIERAKLPRLQAADWSYYAGDPRRWESRIENATPILKRPAQLGWTSPCYVPALRRYLLVSWYVTPTLKKWFEPGEVKYDFFEAPHPWGPWTFVSSLSDRFIVGGHMYGPNIIAKFQEGNDREARVLMFTSGCPFQDVPDGLYKLWCLPLDLKTEPSPPARFLNDNDPAIVYHGTWSAYQRPERQYLGGDIHATEKEGDAAELSFDGTGIEVVSERYRDMGAFEVILDGTSRGLFNPALENFPRLVRVPFFAAKDLAPGRHSLRLVNRSKTWMVLDGFNVRGGR